MKIHVLPSGPIQTIGYLLTDAQLGEAVLIDGPGDIVKRIQPILAKEGVKLTEHWITHGHWDHMQDSAKVKREFGARVIAHKADCAMLETPEIMEARMGRSMGLEPVAVDAWVEQGDVLKALGREFEVRHVPGHCPGNILFYQAEGKVAFVGDALFNRGVGRWDFPGGNFNELANSIRTQIYTLPDETIVFPGHGERTTVGEEKAENPYVAAND
ncbi:MBL fold metallo-hydrolase [Oleiharenicola lentus]|uniref:MBL fold metallo-hydrolase n=1 Tax=Oleiharenicola lentus TaxID=2508720 RepID=UPI003F678FCF